MAGVYDAAVFDSGVFETGGSGLVADGELEFDGVGVLTTELPLVGAGGFVLTGAALLTTQIALAAAGVLTLTGVGRLTSVSLGRALEECGHPVYAIEDWQNDE